MEYIYAALLLHKAGKKIDENGVKAVLTAAGVAADESRIKALIAALDGVNIEEAISKAASTGRSCRRSTRSRPCSRTRQGRAQGRGQESRRRERHGRARCPVRLNLFFLSSFPVLFFSRFLIYTQFSLSAHLDRYADVDVVLRRYDPDPVPDLTFCHSQTPRPPGFGAMPNCSPWIQPGAMISTVAFSPFLNTCGSEGRRTVPKSLSGLRRRGRPDVFSHSLMLRLKNCHQLWTLTPFGVTAVPVPLELLDAERREPFSSTAFPGKINQLRDLGVVDARHIHRGNEKIDGTFCHSPCCAAYPIDRRV